MTDPSTEKVTEEQATEALHQLSLNTGDEPAPAPEPAPEPPVVKEPPTEPVKEPQATGTEEVTAEGAAEPEPEGDDVESLKALVETMKTDAEKKETSHTARMKAFQDRSAQSERILTDRLLRKSTTNDKALKVLKAIKSESGAAEADTDRVIQELEAGMNPASASHAQPEPRSTPTATNEDQQLISNRFLNEQGMTDEEADEFGKWVTSDSQKAMSQNELDVADESLSAFLRLAHSRWRESVKAKQAKVDGAIGATRVVQRIQREAGRAASASPAAPRKQPASPKAEKDFKDFTTDDISKLLRESVEHPD